MEFVVHVKNEYDYRFICEERDKLFLQIKAVFFNKMNQNLPIYDVPENLKNYATSKKEIKDSIEKMPPDSYRNKAEDIYEPFDPTQNSTRSTASSNSKQPQEADDDLSTIKSKPTYAKNGDTNISLADFQIKKVIGRGSFGKVFLVQKKDTG